MEPRPCAQQLSKISYLCRGGGGSRQAPGWLSDGTARLAIPQMDSWVEQPWTRRWWRMPGEALLSESLDGRQVDVQLSWCQPNEWGLKLVFDDGHSSRGVGLGSFLIDAEEVLDLDVLPKAVVAVLINQLKSRERGIRDAPKLASDPLLTAIAEVLPKEEWATGRRLRKLMGLDIDAFRRQLGTLMPRYVRREAMDEDDKYSLTLPGLLLMDARLGAVAIMESIYRAIARCYERNDDAEVFENADIVACGVSDSEVPLARTIARISLLAGGGAMLNERVLPVPADREMIAAQVKKGVRFLDYLHHAATEKQRNALFAVDRPWLQAPLWGKRDGSQPDYLPKGFLAPAVPLGSARRPLVETALNDDLSPPPPQPEDNKQPEHRLPRLDVTYGKKLGDGAFGTVWEAMDTLLERKLAVKFLTGTAEHLDEDALLRQARSLAKVSHPNLVVVYCAAWLRHPVTGLVAPAIMMELLEGESFLRWSAIQHDRDSVFRVATGLLSGIGAMHAAGLYHGDLHSQNVIALPGGQAKVIDWRYQDTFLARSTASRNEIIEADERHAIDLVVSLFEKQGLRDESLELRRVSGVAAARAFIDGMASAAPAQAAPTSIEGLPPAQTPIESYDGALTMWREALAERQVAWRQRYPEYGTFSLSFLPNRSTDKQLDHAKMRKLVQQCQVEGLGLTLPNCWENNTTSIQNRPRAIEGKLDLDYYQELWQLHNTGVFMDASLLHYVSDSVLWFEAIIWLVALGVKFAQRLYVNLDVEQLSYEFKLENVKDQSLGTRSPHVHLRGDRRTADHSISAGGSCSILELRSGWRAVVYAVIREMFALFNLDMSQSTIDGWLDKLGK